MLMKWYHPCMLMIACLPFGCTDRQDEHLNPGEPQLEFRLALELKPDSKIWEASHLFKEALEKASPEDGISTGEIKVNFYDQGSIGTERQLLEACYFGAIEVVQVNTAIVTTIEPAYAVLNLPYLFINKAHLHAVLQGSIGQEMLHMLTKHHLQGLNFYSAGFRNIFYKFPIDKPCADTQEAFGGLKIRVMESPVMISSINAMGASATPIPFSELYQALKTGVVDGAENSAKVFVSYNYEETGCNCFTLTEHSTDQHVLIANAPWLNSLEPKYKKRILEVAKAINTRYDSIWEETTKQAMTQMKQHDVRVNQLADKEAFIASVKSVHPQFFAMYPDVSRSLYDRIIQQSTTYAND